MDFKKLERNNGQVELYRNEKKKRHHHNHESLKQSLNYFITAN